MNSTYRDFCNKLFPITNSTNGYSYAYSASCSKLFTSLACLMGGLATLATAYYVDLGMWDKPAITTGFCFAIAGVALFADFMKSSNVGQDNTAKGF